MAYKDKEKEKAAKLRHYYKNKKQYYERNKSAKKELVDFLKNYKKGLKCVVCGESESVCIDMHHVNPIEKDTTVNFIIRKYNSLNKLKEELNKCIPVCANCHRKFHAGLIQL